MNRETWKSRLGFMLAAMGSAVGLANIWKFPYLLGENGGAAFLLFYLFCIFAVSIPIFIGEITAGRTSQNSPCGTFLQLGGKPWKGVGKGIVFTGLCVSAIYSVIAGWVVGYLFAALRGKLQFETIQDSKIFFDSCMASPFWGIGCHFFFMLICALVPCAGVRKGIENGSQWMMPSLLIILLILVARGLTLPGSSQALHFLFSPDWKSLTIKGMLLALGQAFFTLSLGQGTMITYGSYLSKKENIFTTCLPIALSDTLVSLLAGIAIFTSVFTLGLNPSEGEGLLFKVLPFVFSHLPGTYLWSILFFLLVAFAAITSQISAMETVIAYLIDEKKMPRVKATLLCASTAFFLGIPASLSFNVWSQHQLLGENLFTFTSFIVTSVLIPLGGLALVFLVGWRWKGFKEAFEQGGESFFRRKQWIAAYLKFCLRYVAPILIIAIMVGLFVL